MDRKLSTYVVLLLFCIISNAVCAQKFSVASFRVLPNDVSAFINPVRDLNDEDCALLKIQGNEDFVFSTPLGVIKRIDNVGEIWLYIPAKSKKITIKHPEWGVLRDYMFPEHIVSHLTYELVIAEPEGERKVAISMPPVQTIRDTLVITRTDTLLIQPVRPRIPLSVSAIATIGFGGKSKTLAGGIFICALKRHGAFIHLTSDFGKSGRTSATCDRFGVIAGYKPFYSSKTYHGFMMANAGAIHRLSRSMWIFEGLGYAQNNIAWQLADSEGATRVKNSYFSSRGISLEAGAVYSCRRLSFLVSLSSIKGKEWFGNIGIGYRF